MCAGRSGEILSPVISWQDMRGAAEIEKLRKRVSDKDYYAVTGLPNNPVFTLGKILWIKKNNPSLYRRTEKFVLVHDYVLNRLGCDDFYSDLSNASLTGLVDISAFKRSDKLLKASGISGRKFPELVKSGERLGAVSRRAARRCGLKEGTPIIAGGGDQQCAGLGAGAVKSGIAEITLGTAAVTLSFSDKKLSTPKEG